MWSFLGMMNLVSNMEKQNTEWLVNQGTYQIKFERSGKGKKTQHFFDISSVVFHNFFPLKGRSTLTHLSVIRTYPGTRKHFRDVFNLLVSSRGAQRGKYSMVSHT